MSLAVPQYLKVVSMDDLAIFNDFQLDILLALCLEASIN